MKNNYNIRVLERAHKLLGCFTGEEPEKSLAGLVRETGFHKSTVFRILETLESMRWVHHDSKTGLYRLGICLFEMGSRAVKGFDFYKVSRPHLEELVKETGQSAHLVIHDEGEAFYLNKIESTRAFITQPSSIGTRMPMHCTAVGKVLLAYMGKEQAEDILDKKGLIKKTSNTITSKESLFSELENIRRRGYAVDNEEIQEGLRCIAAPLCDHSGQIIAAISVSGLVSQFNDNRESFFITELFRASSAISQDLGCDNCKIITERILDSQ